MLPARNYRQVLWLPVLAMLAAALVSISADDADAVPSFARKYKTSCVTCHYAFPKLNAFGKAFKNNGFRYPEGQDPEMTKEDPVNLGAESYKRVWPDAIWPADIAGTSPLSFHAIGRLHYFDQGDLPTFEIPHELEFLFGGTIGDDISYFGELELEHESELAYEFLVQYDFNPGVHLRFGSVGLDHVTPENERLTKSHYNVVNLKNQSGTWRMRSGAGGGMELWGAVNGTNGSGGLTYSVGVGNGQNDADNFDRNQDKDVFARATYKIGGLGEAGGTEGQASEQSAFYIDNSLRLGTFGYFGTAVDGAGIDDEFWVAGGDVELWYNRLIVSATGMVMNSDYQNVSRDSFAGFVEGNYVIYPWLIGYTRFEYTDKDTDADVEAEKNLVPAVVAMIRANVKASLEFLIPLEDARDGQSEFALQFNFAF